MRTKNKIIDKLLFHCNCIVFAIFVFFAPFSYFGLIPSLSNTSFVLPFFVSVVGIPLVFIYYFILKKELSRYFLLVVLSFCFCTISSIIISAFLSRNYNNYFGLNPFDVTLKFSLQSFYTLLLFVYIFICCKMFGTKKIIWISFFVSVNVVAFIGDSSIQNGLAFEGLNELAESNHKVIIILNDNDINYIQEYTFEDLKNPKTNKKYRFDFAIFKNNKLAYLIEFDGRQHYSGPESD